MQSQWRDIPGYEGCYQVSDGGEIRRTSKMRLLKLEKTRSGYLRVMFCRRGVRSRLLVHRAVAYAFLGAPQVGQQVNHKDGDKARNAASNLEYVTPSENEQHSRDVLGKRSQKGEAHGRSRLTNESVREIRTLRAGGMRKSQIAQQIGVSHRTVTQIVNGDTWRHLA